VKDFYALLQSRKVVDYSKYTFLEISFQKTNLVTNLNQDGNNSWHNCNQELSNVLVDKTIFNENDLSYFVFDNENNYDNLSENTVINAAIEQSNVLHISTFSIFEKDPLFNNELLYNISSGYYYLFLQNGKIDELKRLNMLIKNNIIFININIDGLSISKSFKN